METGDRSVRLGVRTIPADATGLFWSRKDAGWLVPPLGGDRFNDSLRCIEFACTGGRFRWAYAKNWLRSTKLDEVL